MLLATGQIHGYDKDAADYINRVEIADGQRLEETTRKAFNSFVVGCKADNTWDAIKASCILAGARTLAGALIPLKGIAPTNNNFVAADYDRKSGLKGNASNKWINTNKAWDDEMAFDDFSAGVFVTELPTAIENSRLLECANFTSAGLTGITYNIAASIMVVFNRAGASNSPPRSFSSTLNANQFVGMNRIGNNWNSRLGMTIHSANSSATSPVSSYNWHLYRESGTSAGQHTNARQSFYFLGTNLNLSLMQPKVNQLMTDINNAF
jgi:hypothetical protein